MWRAPGRGITPVAVDPVGQDATANKVTFLLIYWGVCCKVLGPVYDNEKENWRILTNKDIYAMVKNPTVTETIRLNRLRSFGHVQRMEENRIPKRVLYMNLGTTSLRGRPRNRWQDEVREDGRIVGGEGSGRKKYITERNGRSS